ncbi:MAG TPA: hypothetical protein VGX28_10545 [Frankiaceae bacterium]|jgi:hypothetical protein|nr:hypothetical protein [Frankiaceae bacterium]
MGSRWGRAVLAVVLLLLAGVRMYHRNEVRQREREDRQALEELRERLRESPAPARTTMSAAPVATPPRNATAPPVVASHEGWFVDGMTAWCEDGRWAGEASAHATTRSPRTWGFVFTLLDGSRVVGELHGQDDHVAYMDRHSVVLTSDDACSDGTFAYRWAVEP